MSFQLHRLALAVEQHHMGYFYWVMHQLDHTDGTFERLAEGATKHDHYDDALAAGYGLIRTLARTYRGATTNL